ncbi:glycosyltransferase [Skermania piniformis]|uniref:glycosyltransferase n=1 Tax=Skermania pinensis TaxID=39122 RepID=UPI001FE5FAEB|nr:glycosyltransferase [Skermania piniformis]
MYVIDDGSDVSHIACYAPLRAFGNIELTLKKRNSGIANSLNRGFDAALANGCRFILTLDQDAIVDRSLFSALDTNVALLESTVPGEWGVVGPGILNGTRYTRATSGLVETAEIIQSGAVFNSLGLLCAGTADESLVIDSVDTDMCLRFRRAGFRVYADTALEITHPVGSGNSIELLGRRIAVTGHSASRRYTMTRNRLEMFRRHGGHEPRWLMTAVRRFLVSSVISVTIEDHRADNLRAILLGCRDFAGRALRAERSARAYVDDSAADTVGEVAVVLVVHNGVRYLEEQVRSILRQTLPPARFFLVDDGSTDGSVELVEKLIARDGRTSLVVLSAGRPRSPDLYTRIATNYVQGMVAAAGYRFIALSDQDDIWEPDRLEYQRERLRATGARLTAANGALIGPDGLTIGRTLRDEFPVPAGWTDMGPDSRLRAILRSPMATGATMMLDRRLLRTALPVPAGWLHDRWFSLVGVARDEADFDDRPVIRYRVHSAQAVGIADSAERKVVRWTLGRVRRPRAAARKMRDLAVTLRAATPDPDVRLNLSWPRILSAYLRPRPAR